MRNRYNESEFTRIAYYLIVLAVIIQAYLWIMHIFDTDDPSKYFTYIAMIEAIFGTIGLLLLDPLKRKGFHLKPDHFKKLDTNLLTHTGIIFIGIMIIQITVSFIPLTVKDWEIALSIMFAGPCEEVFFRGFLVSIFITAFSTSSDKYSLDVPGKKDLNYGVMIGIIISAIAFAGIHINYYNQPNLLVGVFLGGLWLGFTYWYWEDLSACILAHFLLNFIVVINQFWLVSF